MIFEGFIVLYDNFKDINSDTINTILGTRSEQE